MCRTAASSRTRAPSGAARARCSSRCRRPCTASGDPGRSARCPERVDRGLAFILADVGHALEELRLDEELAVARDLPEQRDRLVEVAVATVPVIVAAEQE